MFNFTDKESEFVKMLSKTQPFVDQSQPINNLFFDASKADENIDIYRDVKDVGALKCIERQK